jgi:asparagine synthase (glutamine-hydrolysing)
LKDADSYAIQLESEGAVIASFTARRAEISRQLQAAAAKENLQPITDEALLDEVTGLVERPNVLTCQFENEFLEVNKSKLNGLQKIMNLDFDNILAGNLLVKMDIATMAHSLEGRSPLLSKEILEYIPSINDHYKIKRQQTKYLLRTLAEKYLPGELIHQPKRGFEIPLKKWIDHELKDIIASYILAPGAYCRNFVQPSFVENLWQRKIKTGDEKRAKMLWTLFALEVWYKKCHLK